MTRELEFHLHDSSQHKTSESYGEIKEAKLLKVKKTFIIWILIVKSISTNKEHAFSVT